MSPDEARRILGVSDTATQDEIKLAARRHAARTHPDKHPGLEEQFRKGQRAADVLSNRAACRLCDGSGSLKSYRGAIVTESVCPACWGLKGASK